MKKFFSSIALLLITIFNAYATNHVVNTQGMTFVPSSITINVASLRQTRWNDFVEAHNRLRAVADTKNYFVINRFKKLRNYYGYYDYNYSYYDYDYSKS